MALLSPSALVPHIVICNRQTRFIADKERPLALAGSFQPYLYCASFVHASQLH